MDDVIETALVVIVPPVCTYEMCILNSPLATEAYHSAKGQVDSRPCRAMIHPGVRLSSGEDRYVSERENTILIRTVTEYTH